MISPCNITSFNSFGEMSRSTHRLSGRDIGLWVKEEKQDHNSIGRWFRNQKKKDVEAFLKGMGGRITYGTEGLFLPLTLGLPNSTQMTQTRFTSELQ